jgi:uncharacterized protein (TIGR00251 family)
MRKMRLQVRISPRSSRNQIVGWQDDVLAIKLTAPPVKGAANKAAVEFLADLLGLRRSQVTLASGATSRDKVFEIEGISLEEIKSRLRRV